MYYLQVWGRFEVKARLCIHGRDIITLLKYGEKLGLHVNVVKGTHGRGPLYFLTITGKLMKVDC